ncbi:GNAT family N-acetyltransferase [Leifsonia soli]|uniref:GNAT superfamily N-acetyltransferase n=1 Tax=Leifsonia soli TaxID=582665 RepID=A0A852SZ75_9MICO|nr:GNAT superfamily N-acetyltransferase [Leifsonia soli]
MGEVGDVALSREPVVVRQAQAADTASMAEVHVRSWQETYRGVMPDAVLDDPDAVARRTRFWNTVLTDSRFSDRVAAVAEVGGAIIGIAMAQPLLSAEPQQLHVLYVLRTHHGTGAGAALLDAVLRSDKPASLWVADPNPRAQAFYRKHGFVADGNAKDEDGVREIRLRRASS